MNKELYSTDDDQNLFLPVTQEDSDFALKVLNKYDVPFDELCWLTRELRYQMQRDDFEFDHDLKLKADYQELFASDIEIKGIRITTNKGTIETKYPDRLFSYCTYAIQRMNLRIDCEIKRRNIYYNSELRDDLYDSIMFFFDGTSLGNYQKCVAIGMFLVYFKIYKEKPIMTEEEFEANRTTEAQDYWHYLYDIVKTQLRKFQKGFSI